MASNRKYLRMWENKGHRPYWALFHVYGSNEPFRKFSGFSYKSQIYVVDKNASNAAYYAEEEMQNGTVHFERYWSGSRNIRKYYGLVGKYFPKLKSDAKKYRLLDWKGLQAAEIVRNLEYLEKMVAIPFALIFFSQPQHVKPLEGRLRKMLEAYPDPDAIISTITVDKMPLPFDAEHLEVAKLRKVWSKMGKSQKTQSLASLAKKYGWFGGIEGEKDYGPEYFESLILEDIPKERRKLSIPVAPKALALGRLIARLSNIRMWCRFLFMSLRHCIKLGVMEICRRHKQPILEYATLPEIYDYVKTGKIDWSQLARRKKLGYVAIIRNGKPILLTGRGAEKYKNLVKESFLGISEVRGSCASPGKATGKVRIVSFASRNYHLEILNFKRGEILVTGMTRPQIVHLCRKAIAIITDEGGITSHAAIVSRELGIPALIGTRDATKVFRTGDLVELDAGKGFARKISR